MSFQAREPVLVIGLGGTGAGLAAEAGRALGADFLAISNDERDRPEEGSFLHVSTGPVINPSIQLIRGSAFGMAGEIAAKISGYSTVIMMSNLAGKAGAGLAPAMAEICKEAGAELVSFAIMPFRYEKDRIFNSGVSLRRLRENSQCTIVLDNDSLSESNPDLSPKECYGIANSAIMHVVRSMGETGIAGETSVLSSGRGGQEIEDSLRDSLKMLYGSTHPDSVKRSMLYVVGGENLPTGVIRSITSLTEGTVSEDSTTQTDGSSEESKVVMVSSVQGMAKFERYDPLGAIPQENMLDWQTPESSIDCGLDLYQME